MVFKLALLSELLSNLSPTYGLCANAIMKNAGAWVGSSEVAPDSRPRPGPREDRRRMFSLRVNSLSARSRKLNSLEVKSLELPVGN
jgi:hypothetical protein